MREGGTRGGHRGGGEGGGEGLVCLCFLTTFERSVCCLRNPPVHDQQSQAYCNALLCRDVVQRCEREEVQRGGGSRGWGLRRWGWGEGGHGVFHLDVRHLFGEFAPRPYGIYALKVRFDVKQLGQNQSTGAR